MKHKNVRIIEVLSFYQIVEIQLLSESKQEEKDTPLVI